MSGSVADLRHKRFKNVADPRGGAGLSPDLGQKKLDTTGTVLQGGAGRPQCEIKPSTLRNRRKIQNQPKITRHFSKSSCSDV